MAWVGVDFAGFGAMMVFSFCYIPTIGSILAIVAPALLTLVQFDHLTPFLIVLLVIGTILIVAANMIEPAIMGRSLNLSPLIVIVSLMVGHDLGQGRHIPVRADHGDADDRVRPLRDHAACGGPALGRKPHSRARGAGRPVGSVFGRVRPESGRSRDASDANSIRVFRSNPESAPPLRLFIPG